jgi:hypothetical protein
MGDYWEPKDAIAREKKISVGFAPQQKERTYHYVDETDQANAKPSKAETSQHIKWQKSQNEDQDRKRKTYCCSVM